MTMNQKQSAQVKRFIQWLIRSNPTHCELVAAMVRLNKRTGLDVANTVLKVYFDKVSKVVAQ